MAALLCRSFPIFFLILVSGFSPNTLAAATDQRPRTFIFSVDALSKPSIFPSHLHWYTSEFADPLRILHVYDTVFHGFSATLTPEEAAAVSRNPSVLAVFEDAPRQLHTTRSPQFLGLRPKAGLWTESDYGSEVIIGILDTGIWPERRSFSDVNIKSVPSKWRGICQAGERFTAQNCNRKLIGARFFNKGHDAAARAAGLGGVNRTAEYVSPRDADGHGTHTASTAAGRYAFKASMEGYAAGIAKGVAPKARLAVYKVCWKESGCFTSDILAAFDAAVADGVDVISISIGGSETISSPFYLDPIAIGAYGAVSQGVFVASSAGNDGPTGNSATNLAPWLVAVGASTIDRNFPAEVVLGNGRRISGVSLYSGPGLNRTNYPLVFPGGGAGTLSASLCVRNSLDRIPVKNKILLCFRGENPRVEKGLVVKKAGGAGMILANSVPNGEGLVGDAHLLPACGVGADEGRLIREYISSSPATATATISFRGTILGIKPAPVVASFSGRGPNALNTEILKPDLIAPGVNILAAWTDDAGPTGLDSDFRRTEFNILSGTSMACPHVSGAAALLKSAHPTWSPAMIRSAMMTTATVVDNRNQIMLDEATGKASTPFDFGAGSLRLESAMDPGLVFDISKSDYVRFLCGIGYDVRSIQIVVRKPVACPRRLPSPENLNYPSIVAVFSTAKVLGTKKIVRTVTNVGSAKAVYVAKIEAPARGVAVAVAPDSLVFNETVKRRRFVVTVSADGRSLEMGESGAVFGSLIWSDGLHSVRSPIVVTQSDPV